MKESSKPNRPIVRTMAPEQGAPNFMISECDIDKAIQKLSFKSGKFPTETEIAEHLGIDLTCYRRHLRDLEIDEFDTEEYEEEEEASLPSDKPRKGPFFPSRFTQAEVSAERSLGDATSPQDAPKRIISAPTIEEAIRTLYFKLGRAPTEVEIVAELRIDLVFYRETLNHLKDLEIGVLRAEKGESGEEWLAYVPDGSEGDVLFRCLRSEMQALFTNAIQNLPSMERLIITLRYHDDGLDSKSLQMILELPEATISNIRTSAVLHLCAWLPKPELQFRRPRPLSAPSNGSTSEGDDNSARTRCSDYADVTVNGDLQRQLSQGQPWEWLGNQASLERTFTSWYSLDGEKRLTQIGREEHYHLKLDF